MESRTYSTRTEELPARRWVCYHLTTECLVYSRDCLHSWPLCHTRIWGLEDLVSGRVHVVFGSHNLPRCISDRWNTFTFFPLLAGTLTPAGLSLGNVACFGMTDGALQKLVLSDEQMYRPSSPATSALARTCVHTAPKALAS